ncbi:MAG: ATP-binding domain-containing protein, partial [Deltaproteobacteria bacterium]|nr:ATP-binding domain-containing protein [Deltaproteobacteria bacterium]
VFRQARESAIIMNAHRIRNGDPPLFERSDESDYLSEFYFIEQRDTAKIVDTIVELCSRAIPEKFSLDPVQDIQVITPMHKGEVGTINLNQVLQKNLNRLPDGTEKIQRFKTGDKVMHLKNNYVKEVFNGDIGWITAVDKKEETLTVDYEGRNVPYDFAELDELTLAYAITIHKSQGSEYPAVIIPVTTQHYVMLQRNLIYTAATRGRKLVILIGTRKALAIALKNDKPRQRLSFLAERLAS